MRTIKFVNPDFTGIVNEQRNASRGIIIENNKEATASLSNLFIKLNYSAIPAVMIAIL